MSKLDPEQRRLLMGRFRSADTKPEILVRKALHAAGRRFRLHVRELPGRPDIVMRKDRCVVLVHGCFWHSHQNCPIARVPKTQSQFWEDKFATNKARDARVASELERLGWRVIVIWECEARSSTLNDRLSMLGLVGPREIENATLDR